MEIISASIHKSPRWNDLPSLSNRESTGAQLHEQACHLAEDEFEIKDRQYVSKEHAPLGIPSIDETMILMRMRRVMLDLTFCVLQDDGDVQSTWCPTSLCWHCTHTTGEDCKESTLETSSNQVPLVVVRVVSHACMHGQIYTARPWGFCKRQFAWGIGIDAWEYSEIVIRSTKTTTHVIFRFRSIVYNY